MKTYALVPLAVSFLCLAWVWFANRRPRITGALWPSGFEVSGDLARPDLEYDGDVVLACDGRFGEVRCRSLRIARGARVRTASVDAARVHVDGHLDVDGALAVRKRLVVGGVLQAQEAQAPRIDLGAGSRSTVLKVRGKARIERHPRAVIKGFFGEEDDLHALRPAESASAPEARKEFVPGPTPLPRERRTPPDETLDVTALSGARIGSFRR